METLKNYTTLSGLERVAVLMLSLSEQHASKIFSYMDENEIKDISKTMSNLGKVPAGIVESLLIDFTEQLLSSGSLVGSLDSTRRMLMKIMPQDKVDVMLEQIQGPAGRTMWDKLSNINEELLANYLKNEYPQTVAVVLSRIRPDHAARVVTLLPENLVMEVMLRMLRMENVRKEILEDIERTLRVEFVNNLDKAQQRDTYEVMANIFNYMDRANETRLLASLEERNFEAAERIRQLMFTFDDMVRIDKAGIQAVIRVADKTKLAMALKGATDTIKDLFFSNMSERGGKILKDDMESLGMVRVKDVEEAQSYVVTTAKDLAEKGEIRIRLSGEDDERMVG